MERKASVPRRRKPKKSQWSTLFLVIVQHVSSFLCIVDRFAMSFVCKSWSTFDMRIYETVERYLLDMFPENNLGFPNGREFLEKLPKHRTVISGGFLLCCLYGAPWELEKVDIDLYTLRSGLGRNDPCETKQTVRGEENTPCLRGHRTDMPFQL